MNKLASSLFLVIIAALAVIFGFDLEQPAEGVAAKNRVVVSRIIDGDTVEVLAGRSTEKVRLIGIDTPEKGECYFEESKNYLNQILEHKEVIIESDPTQSDRDKYSRLLRYIYMPDGTDIAQVLIEKGYGYEYTYQKPYKNQQDYKGSQAFAELNDLGLHNNQNCLQ